MPSLGPDILPVQFAASFGRIGATGFSGQRQGTAALAATNKRTGAQRMRNSRQRRHDGVGIGGKRSVRAVVPGWISVPFIKGALALEARPFSYDWTSAVTGPTAASSTTCWCTGISGWGEADLPVVGILNVSRIVVPGCHFIAWSGPAHSMTFPVRRRGSIFRAIGFSCRPEKPAKAGYWIETGLFNQTFYSGTGFA